MNPSTKQFLDIFRRYLPSRYGCVELWFDPAQEDVISIDETGSFFATLRVSIFDSAESDTLRDVKEQQLLLQIDAQEANELLLNQDGGFFFFFIPADALAKHDWTRAWGVLQCH